MANVLDAAGGKIVDDKYFVAVLQIRVGKMRADKTRSACDQNSQIKDPFRKTLKISIGESNTFIAGIADGSSAGASAAHPILFS